MSAQILSTINDRIINITGKHPVLIKQKTLIKQLEAKNIEDSKIEISVRLLTFETPILSEKSLIDEGV